ncbi:MAG: hypothetical protein D0433_11325 [Candidatus Thermochlorobacter aerophilum]|jgi:hypothetical protein|uniref:Uncharacterized protein n=1 Tax=Candidatus Thermochlorobacter aerophilus TaxID=1868324 RepID=A0A395LXV9_9BACT|nr:MAG: hypothetical protein D0433_11325 [Candidatus Thermochlorobacter aerophilum]
MTKIEKSATTICHVERSETSILDSSLWLGMTQKSAQNDTKGNTWNDTFAFVMLDKVKHSCTGFLTAFGIDRKKCGRHILCSAIQ